MKTESNFEKTGNPIEEVTFSFYDGSSYVARPENVGDTITGEFAHKMMYALQEYQRRGNTGFGFKIGFLTKWSEDVANNPNGVYSHQA